MKVILINCSQELTNEIQETFPTDNISSRENANLKVYASSVVHSIKTTDLVIVLLNKDTFNITSILTLLALAKEDVSKICLLIDTQFMSKEEESLLDDVIDDITDFISCVIIDDFPQIPITIINYIGNYKKTY